MNLIDKQKLLDDMNVRLQALEDFTNRDFSGGMQSYVEAVRELRVWRDTLSRGDYDMQIWE